MPNIANVRFRCRTSTGWRGSFGQVSRSRRSRQRTVDHVDGILQAIDRDERAEPRSFLLAEQYLIKQIEPIQRDAGLAILRLLFLVQKRLTAPDLVDHGLDVLGTGFRRQLRKRIPQMYKGCSFGV